MEQYKKQFDEYMNKLDSALSSVPYMDMISEKIHVRKCYIVLVFVLQFILVTVFTLGCKVLGNFIVFLYPVYASFKAIKSNNKDDDTQWLTYWVIYGLLSVIESVGFITALIPYYSLIRVVALVLCFLPQVQGAKFVYDKVLYPYLLAAKKRE
ncbi:hypothetical protein WA538_000226 [Blastocystis sp. DL]